MKYPSRVAVGVLAGTLGIAVVATSLAGPLPPKDIAKQTTEANITRLTTSVLAASQFAHHPLDDRLAAKLIERYLDALDGGRLVFLQSDVDEFAAFRPTLARATREAGDLRAAHAIFARFLERLDQRAATRADLLAQHDFDFTGSDSFAVDRRKAARPRDLAAARALWRQELRAEYLQEKLGDAPGGTRGDSSRRPDEIVALLKGRHERQLRMVKALGENALLETYLDALAHVYDPHSDYLGREEMESLSIAMNLSLFGVGAALSSDEDGGCTVRAIVPGGPADASGRLRLGDRIATVAQDGAAPVALMEMPLSRIATLVRGPKGSAVNLGILPPQGVAGPPETVRLVRAEVSLDDKKAKARLIELPQENGGSPLRLGVVELPSFYADGQPGGRGGAAADVAKLLKKLKALGVKGVVLDLRRNGGGSLDEAISLTGLFIKSGPVVQTRDPQNRVEVATDADAAVVYDGPLVVLTSRFSASASEIAAGALQDYGRAVIVGDAATFGKGTVQTVAPLAPLMERAGLEHTFDPGGLKVTIRKFYRPSGASTELRGVASDIILPSPSDAVGVGERELTDPLPWDTIPSVRYTREDRVTPHLRALRDRSARRIAADRSFAVLRAEIAHLQKSVTAGTVSLNEAERRRELAAAESRQAELERAARAVGGARVTYPITVQNAGAPGLPAPLAPDTDASARSKPPDDATETSRGEGAIANEALLILSDYVRLQTII